MKLIKGKTYSAPNSTVKVKILAVYCSCEEYTEAKIQLTTIHGFVEIKTYKLYHKRISHWEKI